MIQDHFQKMMNCRYIFHGFDFGRLFVSNLDANCDSIHPYDKLNYMRDLHGNKFEFSQIQPLLKNDYLPLVRKIFITVNEQEIVIPGEEIVSINNLTNYWKGGLIVGGIVDLAFIGILINDGVLFAPNAN